MRSHTSTIGIARRHTVVLVSHLVGALALESACTHESANTENSEQTLSNYAATVLSDLPVAYYRLGESAGSIAVDSSGHGRNGSYQGSDPVLYGRPGAITDDSNTAVAIDSTVNTSSMIAMPSSVNPWSGAFTIEAWIKPHRTPTWRDAIVIWEAYLARGFRAGLDASLRPMLWTGQSGGSGDVTATAALTLDQWNHVAITRSGATISIYVNGTAAGSGTLTYVAPQAGDANGWGAVEGVASNAELDEVTVYATALSAARVMAHYTAGVGPTCHAACGNGVVDSGEQCDGGGCCNMDCTLKAAGTTCRAAAGVCDLAETCSGSSAACPADLTQPNGTACTGGTCQAGVCNADACPTLTSSGPITATADNQVIQNLSITSTAGTAVTVNGKTGVTLKNLRIRHANGRGIYFSNAPNLRIENVEIELTGAPAAGPLPSYDYNNIEGYASSGAIITRVKVTRGSTGIYLTASPGSQLSFIEGHDIRGPFPRGQLVQWNNSNNGSLTDFSVENPLLTSWTEDNVNAYQSTGITVRRGLVDGNNAPSGVGVIADEATSNMVVEDVDAVHQGNGCFAAYTGSTVVHDISFTRVRCRDTHCTSIQGREPPASGGIVFAVHPSSYNIQMLDSSYWNHCNPTNVVWDASRVLPLDLVNEQFTPRTPIRLNQCWN